MRRRDCLPRGALRRDGRHCILPSRSELVRCLGPRCIEAANTAIRAQLNSEPLSRCGRHGSVNRDQFRPLQTAGSSRIKCNPGYAIIGVRNGRPEPKKGEINETTLPLAPAFLFDHENRCAGCPRASRYNTDFRRTHLRDRRWRRANLQGYSLCEATYRRFALATAADINPGERRVRCG